MKHSVDRILTTHAGSLARPPDLLDMMAAKESGLPYDEVAYDARVRSSVAEVVRRQVELGVDVVNDGEQGKPSFITYVTQRLTGLELSTSGMERGPWAGSRETNAFPEFYEWYGGGRAGSIVASSRMICTGPIAYKGHGVLQAEIEALKAALGGLEPEEVFIPAISPTNIEGNRTNEFYPTEEEYLYAIAEGMREEYNAIVDAGFLLQIDDPRLATHYVMAPDLSIEQYRRWAELRVDVLNHALRDISPEKVRHHTCYSINIGPRVHDLSLRDVADIMLRINAGAYSFEAANPRHEHEWRVWETVQPPKDKVLIPGVISHTTNLVEHPGLVAERIMRYANLVGRENVIAGSDCGFSSIATTQPEVHPTVVWAKFQAMVEGARLASVELWGR